MNKFREVFSSSSEETAIYSTVEEEKTLRLQNLSDWCMERLSILSLAGSLDEARALTSEHVEMLESIDVKSTLWMTIEMQE